MTHTTKSALACVRQRWGKEKRVTKDRNSTTVAVTKLHATRPQKGFTPLPIFRVALCQQYSIASFELTSLSRVQLFA
jgi:hypothetical protein